MSSFVIHLTIPLLVVLATGLFPRKAALMWVPFAVINDFDFIFNLLAHYLPGTVGAMLGHRAIFHNIFVGVPTAVFALVLWRRMMRDLPDLQWASWRERWERFGAVRYGYGMVLASFYLWSHVFLDMFQGGVTLFWPFINVYIYPRFIIWVDTQTGLPTTPTAEVRTGSGAPALAPLYPWLTPHDLAILLLALIGLGISFWSESRRARRPKAPVPPPEYAEGSEQQD